MPRLRTTGFTLIELMVTIAVLAILLTLALPSFQQSFRSNRVATAGNELLASLSLARSEAIRSGRGGSVCASADGENCAADWNRGWLVWTDTNADGALDNNETVVRYSQARTKLLVDGPNAAISFDPRGRLLNDTQLQITLQSDTCPSGQNLIRTATINLTGQAKLAKVPCP